MVHPQKFMQSIKVPIWGIIWNSSAIIFIKTAKFQREKRERESKRNSEKKDKLET